MCVEFYDAVWQQFVHATNSQKAITTTWPSCFLCRPDLDKTKNLKKANFFFAKTMVKNYHLASNKLKLPQNK